MNVYIVSTPISIQKYHVFANKDDAIETIWNMFDKWHTYLIEDNHTSILSFFVKDQGKDILVATLDTQPVSVIGNVYEGED